MDIFVFGVGCGRGVISCQFLITSQLPISAASICIHSFTYTNIDTSRARVLISRVSRGRRLSTLIHIYTLRRYHAGSLRSRHSRSARTLHPHSHTESPIQAQIHAHSHAHVDSRAHSRADRVESPCHSRTDVRVGSVCVERLA